MGISDAHPNLDQIGYERIHLNQISYDHFYFYSYSTSTYQLQIYPLSNSTSIQIYCSLIYPTLDFSFRFFRNLAYYYHHKILNLIFKISSQRHFQQEISFITYLTYFPHYHLTSIIHQGIYFYWFQFNHKVLFILSYCFNYFCFIYYFIINPDFFY